MKISLRTSVVLLLALLSSINGIIEIATTSYTLKDYETTKEVIFDGDKHFLTANSEIYNIQVIPIFGGNRPSRILFSEPFDFSFMGKTLIASTSQVLNEEIEQKVEIEFVDDLGRVYFEDELYFTLAPIQVETMNLTKYFQEEADKMKMYIKYSSMIYKNSKIFLEVYHEDEESKQIEITGVQQYEDSMDFPLGQTSNYYGYFYVISCLQVSSTSKNCLKMKSDNKIIINKKLNIEKIILAFVDGTTKEFTGEAIKRMPFSPQNPIKNITVNMDGYLFKDRIFIQTSPSRPFNFEVDKKVLKLDSALGQINENLDFTLNASDNVLTFSIIPISVMEY